MRILPGATRTWIDLSASGPFIDASNLNDLEAKFRAVDALLQAGAIAIQNVPPASPADGQVYVVGTTPTGAWATHANKIARYNGDASAWEFFTPSAGWTVTVGTTDYRWSGSAWSSSWIPPHSPSQHWNGSDPLTGSEIAGLRTTDAPEFAAASLNGNLWLKVGGSRAWSAIAASTAFELASRNADGSAIDWPITIVHDAGGEIRLGGAGRPVNLVNSYLKVGGVDAITSGRAARFTGMRLTNLGSGQIPVCSDGNGEITASGESDDGTYFSSNRIFRSWNALTKTGNTWTALQWTQNPEERVSLLSSVDAGPGGHHTVALFPSDGEASGRFLGNILYCQKVSGKTGSSPGIKTAYSGQSVGAGGTVGGFGGQHRLEYRPDNGPGMVDALRIGAFGGGVADAVETSILLRANAGVKIGNLSGVLKGSSGTVSASYVFTESETLTTVLAPAYSGSPVGARLRSGSSEVYAWENASGSGVDVVGPLLLQGYVGANAGILKTLNDGSVTKAVPNVDYLTAEGLMFRSAGVVPAYTGVEQSALGQTSAKRRIAANTVETGDELELVYDFRSNVDSNSQNWNFYIGPDADYTAAYRPSFTFTNQQLGTTGVNYNHRITFLVRFVRSGSTITACGRMLIERTLTDTYNTGFAVNYSVDFTLIFARNLDRYIDLTALINAPNTSTFSNVVTSCSYKKAI